MLVLGPNFAAIEPESWKNKSRPSVLPLPKHLSVSQLWTACCPGRGTCEAPLHAPRLSRSQQRYWHAAIVKNAQLFWSGHLWNNILPRSVVTSNTKMPQGSEKEQLAKPLYDLEKRIAEPYKNDFSELARAVSGSLVDFTLCEFAGGLVDWRMKRRTHARRQERLMDDPVAVGSLRLQIGSIWPCLLFLLERLSHCECPEVAFFSNTPSVVPS